MSILFFLISLFASVAGAISGIGGGIIIKPVLDATHALSVSTISFLSGCTVLTMSIVSLVRNRKSDVKLDIKRSTFLAVGAAAGGLLGNYLFDLIKQLLHNENTLGAIQSAILLVMTIGVFLYVRYKDHIHTKDIDNNLVSLIIGLLLGLISAFLGIGGGPMNIAVLYYFFSMSPKAAALNSLYIIFFSQITSLITTVASGTIPAFDPLTLVLMILGGVGGALIGSQITKKISEKKVELFFSGLLMIITLINVYNLVRFLM